MAALIGEAFTSVGIEVRTAGSFLEASQFVAQERYDGIFVDPGTPLLEGCEIAKIIRQSSVNQSAPIFILTVQSPTYATAQAFDVCGTFYLQEPVDFDSLAHLLSGSSGTPPDNRRRKVRGALETEVMRRTIHLEFKGMSSDISEDGILFQSDGSLETGQEVELFFTLPDQEPEIRVIGVVARMDGADEKRALVCFTQIASGARRRITEFLANLPG